MSDTTPAINSGSPWTAPDEFPQRLLDLADSALRHDPALRSALARWKDELLVPTLLAKLERQAGTLLVRTNREIDDILQKRRILAEFTAEPPPSIAGQALKRVGVGAGFLLILGAPVLTWQTWPALSTAIGGIWAAALIVAGICFSVFLGTGIFIASRGDDVGTDLAASSFLTTPAVAYAIAYWRLSPVAEQKVGSGWSAGIWIALGVIAVFLGGSALAVLAESKISKGARLRGIADLVLAAAIGVAAWSVLRSFDSVPGHWPEAGALAFALAVGTGGATLARLLLDGIRRPLAATAGSVAPNSSAATFLRTSHDRQAEQLRLDLAGSEARWAEAMTPLLVQRLQAEIAERVNPGFTTRLEQISPHGLQQMRGADYIVHTRSFDRLSAEIAGLSGGAVGLAGPRGAGKSSLLDQYRAGRIAEADTAGRQLVISESVPVTYEPKEYALYLYGRLCEEVARFAAPANKAHRQGSSNRLLRNAGLAIAVGLAWLVTVLVGTGKWPGLDYQPPAWLANGWLAVLATGIVVGVVALGVGTRRRSDDNLDEEGDPSNLDELRERAERRLRTVRFQQKETFSSTGKVRLPFAAERGTTAAQEFQRYPMAYPEIANELHKFLTLTTRTLIRSGGTMSRIPVVIVFDELDKMSDPDRVQDFLNTVKSLFSLEIAGCLFLVSVSEDALARFERRGLPVRDALDSTFDAVVPVEYLNLDDATALIADRVAGLPDPFIALLHALGGGLPRELLRYTRSLVRHRADKWLFAIARSLVGEDLRMKARGLGAVIAKRGLIEPHASDLMRFVNDNIEPDHTELLNAVEAAPLRNSGGEDESDALHLQTEALGYLYYCATVLQVFDRLEENEFALRRDSFDTLASARQLFAVNARLAWLTVSSFRRQWSLPEVAPPG